MYLLDLHFDSDLNSYVYDYPEGFDVKDPFDEIIVGNEDILIYVFFDSKYSGN